MHPSTSGLPLTPLTISGLGSAASCCPNPLQSIPFSPCLATPATFGLPRRAKLSLCRPLCLLLSAPDAEQLLSSSSSSPELGKAAGSHGDLRLLGLCSLRKDPGILEWGSGPGGGAGRQLQLRVALPPPLRRGRAAGPTRLLRRELWLQLAPPLGDNWPHQVGAAKSAAVS